MIRAARGSAHHQPAAAFSASPASTARARMPSTRVTRPLGYQHRVAECPPGPGLARRQREHHRRGHRGPGDPERTVPRPVPGRQDQNRLDRQVGGQGQERDADQPERPPLTVLAGPGKLPQDHRARADLDQRIQPEPGQRHGPGRHRRHGQHDDAGHVPAQRDALQDPSAAQQHIRPRRLPAGSSTVIRPAWPRHRRHAKTSRPDQGQCSSAVPRR